MSRFTSIAFVVNSAKPTASQLAEALVERARRLGLSTRLTTEHPLPAGFLAGADMCCVLGGDGTLLGTVTQATEYGIPVMGINQGKLGFLATFSPVEIHEHWQDILMGGYTLMLRSVLECRTQAGQFQLALNDIVIKSHTVSRLVNLTVSTDICTLAEYSCDGLLFATPTGSTAYNLSAGGPIVHPQAKVITMTPICPHTLSNRSVIFPEDLPLIVGCPAGHTAQVTLDGQVWNTPNSLPVHIRIYPQAFKLLCPSHYSHFQTIRTKLHWR